MTARRAGLLAAALAVAAAVVLTLLTLRSPEPAGRAGSGEPARVVAGPAEPASPPPPAALPSAALPSAALPSAALPSAALPSAAVPPATGRPAAPASPAARADAPAPFIQTFAAQPGVRPLPALRSPTAPLSLPAHVDGCDRGYGLRTQCVPWSFPPGVTDRCAWLARQGFTRLTVTGTDRHRLDPDGNGMACDR